MPAKLERALRRSARKKGLKGRRAQRYIYGGMRRRGWKPRRRRG
jgi:hypothetical protein